MTHIEGVAEVVCYGQCSGSGGCVNEGWQVGSWEHNYCRGYDGDFQQLDSIGEDEHGEMTGGTVQEEGFNNAEGAGRNI